MLYLTLILHLFIGATLAGVGIVIVLVAGIPGVWPLVGAVVGGMVLAIPASYLIARALKGD